MLFYKKLNIVSEKHFYTKVMERISCLGVIYLFLQKGRSSHFSLFLQYLKGIKTSTVFTYIFETMIQA